MSSLLDVLAGIVGIVLLVSCVPFYYFLVYRPMVVKYRSQIAKLRKEE
jgi:hypothetical protein